MLSICHKHNHNVNSTQLKLNSLTRKWFWTTTTKKLITKLGPSQSNSIPIDWTVIAFKSDYFYPNPHHPTLRPQNYFGQKKFDKNHFNPKGFFNLFMTKIFFDQKRDPCPELILLCFAQLTPLMSTEYFCFMIGKQCVQTQKRR